MTSPLGGAADLEHLSEFAGVLVADVSTRRGGFDLLHEISDDPTPSAVADLLLQRSQRSDSLLLISKDGDTIVGLGVAAQGSRVTHIGLFVRPSHRNQGRGTTMLDQLISWAKLRKAPAIFLEVREGNIEASPLYKSAGFETISTRSNYYSLGVDAVIMKKDLG